MDIQKAHNLAKNNKTSVENSAYCGCFNCLEIYSAREVVNFIEEENTAICPKCEVDAVLADKDMEITAEFLRKMHENWLK